jgi:hypothetical protein
MDVTWYKCPLSQRPCPNAQARPLGTVGTPHAGRALRLNLHVAATILTPQPFHADTHKS